MAKKVFNDNPILFHKTIYDLKLFSEEKQIESLEFLVNLSIYDPSLLIDEYNSLISKQDIETNIENLNKKENSPRLRAEVYQLINNTAFF